MPFFNSKNARPMATIDEALSAFILLLMVTAIAFKAVNLYCYQPLLAALRNGLSMNDML